MAQAGRFLDTSAGRVFVRRSGRGAPLVLVHGFLMSGRTFDALKDGLEGHELVIVDLPAAGDSDVPPPARFGYHAQAYAEVLGEVLDRLELGAAPVLGHSLGGRVALALAAIRPDRVERLILLCPTVYPLPLVPGTDLLLGSRLAPVVLGRMSRAVIRRYMQRRNVLDPRLITDELVERVWTQLHRPGGGAAALAAARHLAALPEGGGGDPARVRVPTLLVWGEEDRVVPLEHGRRLERAIAGARLEVVAACGHDLHLERPAEVLQRIRPFVIAADALQARRAHEG